MAQPDVSIRLLRYFVELGDRLNYRRAAEQLFISQPALSSAIKQLEQQLGARLFERDTHRVVLTEFGEACLPRARTAVETVDHALRDMRREARKTGRLRIGYLIGTGADQLFRILHEFQAEFPGIRVEATEFDFSDPTAGLAADSVDVALLRPPVALPEHRMVVVATESWVACLPLNHPFAKREALDIADLLEEPIIAAPETAGTWRDYWIAADARGGRPAPVSGIAPTYEAELTLVAMGAGISFTTSSLARLYSRPGVRFVPILNRPPSLTALAWNPRHMTPELQLLTDSIRASGRFEDEQPLPTE
jgi:DNA-binding transcriptional LysR family regulator